MSVHSKNGNTLASTGFVDAGSPLAGYALDLQICRAMGSPLLGYTYPPSENQTNQTLVNQTLYGVAMYLPRAATLTGVCFVQTTQGNFTANNEDRVGLYTSDGTTLTLVASSTHNASLWKADTATAAQEPFTSPYAAAAGVYWIAGLWNRSAQTTAPAICASVALPNAAMGKPANGSISASWTIPTQSTLPAAPLWSATTASTARPWFGVY